MDKEKPKIFISYSWEDKAISRKLADSLRRDGAQIWIDYSENKAGDSFIRKMNEGLMWCDTFVLLWSESAAKSNFVSMEWEGALAINLKIIPCLLDTTKLPVILSGRIYKDLSDFEESYHSLAADLNLVVREEKAKEIQRIAVVPANTGKSTPEIIKSTSSIFRSYAITLSKNSVQDMLKKLNFFDKYNNAAGNGFKNQFEIKTIKHEDVVIDKPSGLIWQQSGSHKLVDFKKAKKWIIALNRDMFGGLQEWRLPTIEEAMSLMEVEADENNNLFIDPLFDSNQEWIWTCDLFEERDYAWAVDYGYGESNYYQFEDGCYVRAVHSAK